MLATWWMYDNHTFKRLSDEPERAALEALECFDSDPWGSVFVRGREQSTLFELHGHGREKRGEFLSGLEGLKVFLADPRDIRSLPHERVPGCAD